MPESDTERQHRLHQNRCPECDSEEGYWQRGTTADFDYVCEDCRGVFDGLTAERIATKPERSAEKAGDQVV